MLTKIRCQTQRARWLNCRSMAVQEAYYDLNEEFPDQHVDVRHGMWRLRQLLFCQRRNAYALQMTSLTPR